MYVAALSILAIALFFLAAHNAMLFGGWVGRGKAYDAHGALGKDATGRIQRAVAFFMTAVLVMIATIVLATAQ